MPVAKHDWWTTVFAQTRTERSWGSLILLGVWTTSLLFPGLWSWPLLVSELFFFSWVPGAPGHSGALMLSTSTHSECSRHVLLLRGQGARPSWATRGSRVRFLGGRFCSILEQPSPVCVRNGLGLLRSAWTSQSEWRGQCSDLSSTKNQTSLRDQALLLFVLALRDHFMRGE